MNTSGGVDKLEIYRRLGIREVWFWIGGRFLVYRLRGKKHALRERSVVLPDLDLEALATLVKRSTETRQWAAVRAFRRSLALASR